MGFPQVYIQALAGVISALSWTHTEVNKVQTQALSGVEI